MANSKSLKINPRYSLAGLILILVYVVLRMIADPFFWRDISENYAYAFEAGFVTIAWLIYRRQVVFWGKFTQEDALALIAAAACGFVVHRAASLVGTSVPFNLSSPKTIFLLLVLAPVLEELIFRMALWQAILALGANARIVLFATAALFAGGHFLSYWSVPEHYQSFVLYQTFYVLLLGLAAGWRMFRSNAILSAILVHFGFNLGFFIAAKMSA